MEHPGSSPQGPVAKRAPGGLAGHSVPPSCTPAVCTAGWGPCLVLHQGRQYGAGHVPSGSAAPTCPARWASRRFPRPRSDLTLKAAS